MRGRIYATAPVEGGSLHVFLDEEDRDRMIRLQPGAYEKLGLGPEIVGLRVDLERARTGRRRCTPARSLAAQAPEAHMNTEIRPVTQDIPALLPLVEQYWLFEDIAGFDGPRVAANSRARGGPGPR